MGFKQRERVRKRRAASDAAQVEARASGSAAGRWWLTVAVRDGCCARCAGVIRAGRECVYRHRPGELLCVSCAQNDPNVRWRPSLRWERERGRHGRGGG